MTSLISVYTTSGARTQAVQLGLSTVPKTEQNLGEEHPLTLSCKVNLAFAWNKAGTQRQKS